jgi:hypothetical protein
MFEDKWEQPAAELGAFAQIVSARGPRLGWKSRKAPSVPPFLTILQGAPYRFGWAGTNYVTTATDIESDIQTCLMAALTVTV